MPRLLRRGMSYGLRWTEGETADTERGLFFMAYCGSIAEQFEVVQRWVAGGNSSGVASSQGDPMLGVPQAGQARWFQWLDEQGQVRRVALGDEALTTLRWGLYLFVPAMAGLRHIARGPAVAPAPTPQPLAGALYAPGTPAFEDWRQLLQDADQRDTLWRRVRDSDGQVQTPYGLLVADADKALAILRDRGRRYTVRGYGRRFKNSVGPGYLGMDAVGPHAGHDEQAERSGINAAIVAIDEATAYEAAFRHTQARLDQLEADTPLLGTAKLMAVDLPDLGEQVLARLCTEWFGVPDGTHLKTGGTASADPPPRCPRDLVDVARHIFGAHPSPAVSAEGQRRGQALQAAVLAYLESHAATLPEPLPRLSRAIWQGLHPQGLKVVADTIGGVMLGFTPSVFGNYSTLMRAWVCLLYTSTCMRPYSAQRCSVGITLPGFSSPLGSKACFSASICVRSSGLNCTHMLLSFSTPTPCSPVTVPPSATLVSRMSAPNSSQRCSWSGSLASNRISGCRLPSPA